MKKLKVNLECYLENHYVPHEFDNLTDNEIINELHILYTKFYKKNYIIVGNLIGSLINSIKDNLIRINMEDDYKEVIQNTNYNEMLRKNIELYLNGENNIEILQILSKKVTKKTLNFEIKNSKNSKKIRIILKPKNIHEYLMYNPISEEAKKYKYLKIYKGRTLLDSAALYKRSDFMNNDYDPYKIIKKNFDISKLPVFTKKGAILKNWNTFCDKKTDIITLDKFNYSNYIMIIRINNYIHYYYQEYIHSELKNEFIRLINGNFVVNIINNYDCMMFSTINDDFPFFDLVENDDKYEIKYCSEFYKIF